MKASGIPMQKTRAATPLTKASGGKGGLERADENSGTGDNLPERGRSADIFI
jgi:hypothetical protein